MGIMTQLSNFILASLQGGLDPNHNVWEKMREMEMREAMQLTRAEAIAWRMYNLTKDPKYLEKLEKIYDKQSKLYMANGRELAKMYKELKELVREFKKEHYMSSDKIARIKQELAYMNKQLEEKHRAKMEAEAKKAEEAVEKMYAQYGDSLYKYGSRTLDLDRGIRGRMPEARDLKGQVEKAKQELKNAVEKTKAGDKDKTNEAKDKPQAKDLKGDRDRTVKSDGERNKVKDVEKDKVKGEVSKDLYKKEGGKEGKEDKNFSEVQGKEEKKREEAEKERMEKEEREKEKEEGFSR